MDVDPRSIAARFRLGGDVLAVEHHGQGHINDTFLVTAGAPNAPARFILQRLNPAIFRDPAGVMDNIARVLDHLHHALAATHGPDTARRALTLVPCLDGRAFSVDDDGACWRMFVFIERAHVLERVASPAEAYQAARAFGGFLRLLDDYRGPRLRETIPHFHDTRHRFEAFRRATASPNPDRVARAAGEIAFAFDGEPLVDVLQHLAAAGHVPERIVHNDTKLNNVLLDDGTGEGLCVLDLDTVMPGLALHDFGDMVRSGAATAAEDEPDTSRVAISVPVFEALARGFLEGTGGTLNEVERRHMVVAAKVIAFELGLRFLTDYLEGDRYFRARRAHHNLDRCRAQFALVRDIASKEPLLEDIVRRLPTR